MNGGMKRSGSCVAARGNAFTLVELLTVIAIIAVLAAILFPIMAQAKMSAKTAVCVNNMDQLSKAVQMYKVEFDAIFPPALSYDPKPGFPPQVPWLGWDNSNAPLDDGLYGDILKPAVGPFRPGLIDRFLRNEGAKLCSVKQGAWQLTYVANSFAPDEASAFYDDNPTIYGKEFAPMAREKKNAPDGSVYYVGAADGEVEIPGDTLIAWEHKFKAPICNWLQTYNWFESAPATETSHFGWLHRGGSGVAFADGRGGYMPYWKLRRPKFSSYKDIYRGRY